ncbi:ABC transporter permease subunit [Mariniplasma anaerobium]|uniref:Galactoside ABC transporter permease MglC n=1 Tax=Mariniplasma anaerobium TaxID=2735436 RepID=A0A7U9XV90_9MOLU|nr:beta-methylgalactoside transporter [Mariniplasma anaerobium]BCR36691.1 galactoside ABC transporter permease MglC [Mariniplasma anaerobium]
MDKVNNFFKNLFKNLFYDSKGELKNIKEVLINNAIYIIIGSMIIFIIISDYTFLSIGVFKNILTQSSVRLILALGVGGIIILQGTDLSLGKNVGFSAIITASFLQSFSYGARFYETLPDWVWRTNALGEVAGFQWFFYILVLLVAIVVSSFFSGINGYVVAKFKVHPFLATLGGSVAIYGIMLLYFNTSAAGPQPIGSLDPTYSSFVSNLEIFGMEIPKLIIYSILVAVVMWFVWNKTTFGKNMYAVGGNPEAAKISGVSVMKTTVMVYLLAGVLYGIGGYLEAARVGSANTAFGLNYELDAIAACVVGGISFSGGIGKISGAIAGVLMFTIITYGMVYLGIDAYYQYIIKGVIIVAAVALDTRKYIKKT